MCSARTGTCFVTYSDLSLATTDLEGNQIGFAIGVGPGVTKAARGAYEVAKAGGRHAGFLKNYAGRSPAEIRKAVSSLEVRISEHRAWIANPESKIPNFRSLDPRQQRALVTEKWPSDIARQQEQIDILRGLLRGN